MTAINLDSDTEEAKKELEPIAKTLRGLLHLWHMFQSAQLVANEFHQKYNELTEGLKIACTRSLVVDYYKPWSGNYNEDTKSLLVGKSYPFLATIENTSMHEELGELRNKIVGHLDAGYESVGINLKGNRVVNASTIPAQKEGTIDEVFLPAVVTLKGQRGVWWLSDAGKISAICDHIKNTTKLVEQETHVVTKKLRKSSLDHMHVLHRLTDLFDIHELPLVEGNVDIKTHEEDPVPLFAPIPVNLKIGDNNIQSLTTVYEPMPKYPTNDKIEGKGYILDIADFTEDGKLQHSVKFPKYPHPKG